MAGTKNTPKEQKPQEISVDVKTDTFIGSSFAQVGSVSVTDTDVTFEFIFIHAQSKQGQTVSRVTMPRAQALLFANSVGEVIKKHDAKNAK